MYVCMCWTEVILCSFTNFLAIKLCICLKENYQNYFLLLRIIDSWPVENEMLFPHYNLFFDPHSKIHHYKKEKVIDIRTQFDF